MITKTKDGYLVSDKNLNLDTNRPPRYKCPKCKCVYWEEVDVYIDPEKNAYTCQECGTELIAFVADKG